MSTDYCRTPTGGHVAHRVEGDGPPLLLVSDGFVPIETMREEPSLRRCLDRLQQGRRLLLFDRRGVGLSDPLPSDGTPLLDAWVQDAVAVLDAVGAPTADVFASVENSTIGIRLAATHPQRVSRMVLFAPSARALVADDYPIGLPEDVLAAVTDSVTDLDRTGIGAGVLALNAPSVAHDPAFAQWWERAGRLGASPGAARDMLRAVLFGDVRDALPDVRCPVLVLHRQDDHFVPESHSRYVADHVLDGRFVSLPGADDLWWVGDTAPLLDQVTRFLSPADHGVEPTGSRWAGPASPVAGAAHAGMGPAVLAAVERRRRAASSLALLTGREREILQLMADGGSNAAICRELFLSPKTVETHIGRIFMKLGLGPADDVNRRVLAVRRVLAGE